MHTVVGPCVVAGAVACAAGCRSDLLGLCSRQLLSCVRRFGVPSVSQAHPQPIEQTQHGAPPSFPPAPPPALAPLTSDGTEQPAQNGEVVLTRLLSAEKNATNHNHKQTTSTHR